MAKAKEVAEQPEKEAPPPAVDDKAEMPQKAAGPQRATEAAALLAAANRNAAKAEKARGAAMMQRAVGNERLSRLMGGAEAKPGMAKPADAGEGEREGPKRVAVETEAQERLKQP